VNRFFATTNDFIFQDSAGHYIVFKFQMQTAGSQKVFLDRTPPPGAAIDGHIDWGQIIAIEPASGDRIKTFLKNVDGVSRIPGGNDEPISNFQIIFMDRYQPLGMADNSA